MWSSLLALSNAVQTLLAAVTVVVLLGQYGAYRRPYLRLWAAAWTATCVALVVGILELVRWPDVPGPSTARLLLESLGLAGEYVGAAALLAGARALAGGPVPDRRREVAVLLGCGSVALLSAVLLANVPVGSVTWALVRTIPPYAFSALAFLWSAAAIHKAGRRGLGTLLLFGAMLADGALQAAFPLLELLRSAGFGFASSAGLMRYLVYAGSLLQSAVALSTLAWLLQEERGRVETVSGELRRVAQSDTLTGLPNRQAFLAELRAGIRRARDRQSEIAILFLDLDRFRAINDTLGSAVGDELLRVTAERLRATLPRDAVLARLGGDEFTMLVHEPGPPAALDRLAERVLATVREPLRLAGLDLVVTGSLGASIAPAHGEEPDALLTAANMANSRASSDGGDRFQLYASAMGEAARGQLSLEVALRGALAHGELLLYFQPIVTAQTGAVESFEALVRWRRGEGRVVPPSEFLPLCDAAGVSDALDDFVLRAGCLQARQLRARAPRVRVAVNLSAHFFHAPKPVQRVRAALEAAGLEPDGLELEITETVAMRDAESTLAVLRDLKALGVHLAIDDFGTGYSSLAYLRRFPVDKLKIDQSFVRHVGKSEGSDNDLRIVAGIIALAHELDLRVVAEGVETPEQLRALREHRCDAVQGYLISKPVSAPECDAALARVLSIAV